MNSVETHDPQCSSPAEVGGCPIPGGAARETSGDNPGDGGADVPHYLVVLQLQDGRSADLVVPGVTGMGGGGDAAGPGRLNIYAPTEGPRATRRLIGARLFNDLADLVVVTEPLELEIDELPDSDG